MLRSSRPNEAIFGLAVLIAQLALVVALVVGSLTGAYYAVNYFLTLPVFK